MGEFLNKIFGLLLKIGNDKLLHFIIGSIISSIIYCSGILIFQNDEIFKYLLIFISFILVFGVALIKDFIIDSKHDWMDVIITVFGWLFITLNHIIYFK